LESVIAPDRLLLFIGTKGPFGGSVRSVDKIVSKKPVILNAGYVVADDIALLHISGSTPLPSSSEPLPLAFNSSVVPNGWPLVFWGYGASEAPPYNVLRTTLRGEWYLQTSGCFLRSACYRRVPGAHSYADARDSGAPVTGLVKGGWVQRGIFSGPDGPRPKYGASITAQLSWIRAVTGLPNVAPNTIVHDPDTGTSWLVGSDGFRRWIPTGGDYLCLVAQGYPVRNMSTFTAKSIPEDYTTQAVCASDQFAGLQFRLTFGFHNSPLEEPYGTCPTGTVHIIGVAKSTQAPMDVERIHASVGGWDIAPIDPLSDIGEFWEFEGLAAGIGGSLVIQNSNGDRAGLGFGTGCPDDEPTAIPASTSFTMGASVIGVDVFACEADGIYTRPDGTNVSLTVTIKHCDAAQ
jgi:hypothetical protein